MRKIHLFLGVMMLALAILACNLPGDAGAGTSTPLPGKTQVEPTPKATQTTAVAKPADPTPTAVQDQQPTSKPPAGNLVKVDFQGVSFSYPEGLFSAAHPQIAPIELNDRGADGWIGSIPERYLFTFDGYPLKTGAITPQIMLYPIKEFADANAPAGDIAARLDDQLRKNKPVDKNLPFLPMWNAGQVFNARTEILAFQNGRGIRFTTCFAQALVPIDSSCLFYTYQAMTADGKYYLSAIFPLKMAILDANEKNKNFNGGMDASQYGDYQKEMVDLILKAQPADFSPNLDLLDGVVRSVVAMPITQLKGPGPSFSCPGAMASRLKKDMPARVTFTDGTPLRLREKPGKDGAVLGSIPEGGTMTIVDGPQCVAAGIWWQVKVGSSGKVGWVLEGEKANYYVEPWK